MFPFGDFRSRYTDGSASSRAFIRYINIKKILELKGSVKLCLDTIAMVTKTKRYKNNNQTVVLTVLSIAHVPGGEVHTMVQVDC